MGWFLKRLLKAAWAVLKRVARWAANKILACVRGGYSAFLRCWFSLPAWIRRILERITSRYNIYRFIRWFL